MTKNENITTMIKIDKSTAQAIKEKAITPNETYDNIIKRLLKVKQ